MLARGDEHALIHGQDLCASPQGAQLWCQHWIGKFSSPHAWRHARAAGRAQRHETRRARKRLPPPRLSHAAQGLLCHRHRVVATVPTLHRKGAFGHQRGDASASPRGTSDPPRDCLARPATSHAAIINLRGITAAERDTKSQGNFTLQDNRESQSVRNTLLSRNQPHAEVASPIKPFSY